MDVSLPAVAVVSPEDAISVSNSGIEVATVAEVASDVETEDASVPT